MAFEPSTQLKLLNVPFENDYKNVLYYTSKSHQTNVMNSFVVKSYTGFTYIRKDAQMRRDYIMVPEHIDKLYNCNYVMYLNSNYTDKWFYGFITKMEYLNDNNTAIWFETDVYNTWCFDVTIKPSFVEREHTADDTIGSNTQPENFELGEYKCQQWYQDNRLIENDVMVLGATESVSGYSWTPGRYGGVYSGVTYGYFTTPDSLSEVLTKYATSTESTPDAVQCIFMAPIWLCANTLYNNGEPIPTSGLCEQSAGACFLDITLPAIPSTLNGYEVRNKKLFTYPYRGLVVTNQQGSSNVLHNEKFDSYGNRRFRVFGVLTPGCSIRVIPLNYNNIQWNVDEGVNLGKYPVCNWKSDVFTNWLTQNSINLASEFGRSAFNILSTAGSASNPKSKGYAKQVEDDNKAAGVINGVFDIIDSIGNVYAHSMVPDASHGNLNCGDAMFAADIHNFEFQDVAIKPEYARIIDSFFDMFGYKTNLVKEPNKAHRERWWYVKTINLNADGAIPMKDLRRFKAIYDNGVTFWRNASEIENYALSNNII